MPVQPSAAVSSKSSNLSSPVSHTLLPAGQLAPFALVTFLFFLWGIPNSMNDVLIRQFMKSFEISRFQAGLVQSAFYMGYFTLAIPAALLMKKSGYKAGLITGLLLLGTGAFLFWPAAIAGKYGFFLVALFVMASGLSFLETASNPFIAQLGDPESSERRLNFSQAFNPLGNITAALVGTMFIFSGFELTKAEIASRTAAGTYQAYLRFETLRVVRPYSVIAGVAFLWAFLIWRAKFPRMQSEFEDGGEHGKFSELLRHRHFIFAVIAQFFYVGAQVCTWSYLISYGQEYAHLREKTAGLLLAGNFAMFGIGRFASAYLMGYLSPSRLMGSYAATNVALLLIAISRPGVVGLWCVFLTSLFMSVMFPTIFALGLKGLGPNTKIGGSLLVMAIVGGAVLTPVMGLVSETTHSLALSYSVPLAAYVVILLYSFWGATPQSKSSAEIT
jgi:FHS family L-fucose permease-like MFS transporter